MFSNIFITDLIHGHIQCPQLLKKIGFYAARSPLREKFHFVLQLCELNFTQKFYIIAIQLLTLFLIKLIFLKHVIDIQT